MPASRELITGSPDAIASIRTTGIPSAKLGWQKMSALRNIAGKLS